MKKIAIIGASELQNPLIEKAKEMGLETHVFAWKCGDIGEKTADFFYPISITEKEQILKKCIEIGVDAVTTIASDLGNVVANFVARNMGLTANSERCLLVSSNKYEMRKALKEKEISIASFCKVGQNDDLKCLDNICFPIIVKPTDRSGSRGVTKIEKRKELKVAVQKAIEYSFEKKAIIEEYIEGNEYSMECISYKGKHTMLAVTKKYTTGAPHFVETGHIEPSGLSDKKIKEIKKEIFQALNALDIRMGASHSEFKIDKNGIVKIIEIGSRMGGGRIGSDLVKLSTGYDFTKMVIDIALGKEPIIQKINEPSIAAVKYIINKQDYDDFIKLKKNHPNIIKYISQIDLTDEKVVDSSGRFGFYIIEHKDINIIKGVMEQK